MHLYLHIVTDTERVLDPDGQECVDLQAARAEAEQSARALMANELQAGRRAPFGWRVQIADQAGTILETIEFRALAFGGSPSDRLGVSSTRELIERSRAIHAATRRSYAEVLKKIDDAHSHLRTLARLHAILKRLS